MIALSSPPPESYWKSDVEAQKKSIKRRLEQGGAWSQTLVMPEGRYFCYCFYAYSLINMLVQSKANNQEKAQKIAELEQVVKTVERYRTQFPWNECMNINPPGGVISMGHANYVKAGYVIAGGDNKEIIKLFHQQSKALAQAFEASENGFLESFPGHWWPVDNYPAIESLRLHDKLYGTNYQNTTERAIKKLKENLDKKSGLMVAQFNKKGKVIDVPRGCALSMSLAFRPGDTDQFSKQQYKKYQELFYIPVLNMTGIREWLPGDTSDFKVGPVVYDIGAAASGLGIASARANRDYTSWLKLIRGLEAIGFPCWNLNGEKHYFAQNFLLGDILSLWGKTICVWDKPELHDSFEQITVDKTELSWIQLFLRLAVTAIILCLLLVCTIKVIQTEKERTRHKDLLLSSLRIIVIVISIAYFACVEVQFFPALLTIIIASLLETLRIRFNTIIDSGN